MAKIQLQFVPDMLWRNQGEKVVAGINKLLKAAVLDPASFGNLTCGLHLKLLVARNGKGEIVGMGVVNCIQRPGGTCAVISDVKVAARHKKNGLKDRLIAKLTEKAHSFGASGPIPII